MVLVDDVMTTGETAEACARQVLRAGARSVDVVSLRPRGAHAGLNLRFTPVTPRRGAGGAAVMLYKSLWVTMTVERRG